jgi:hypothetical protein
MEIPIGLSHFYDSRAACSAVESAVVMLCRIANSTNGRRVFDFELAHDPGAATVNRP